VASESDYASINTSDTTTTYDASTDTTITLNGSSISVSGSGCTVSGSTVTITTGGTYIISGTLSDGQIIVTADSTDKVYLVLNGVNITCSYSAPIYVSNCDKTIITLNAGTTNTLTDGTSYTYADATNEEPNACLYCDDDLTINGEGTLIVNANFNNGIQSKDDLKITGGTITVNAVNNGIKGKDSVTISGGTITINAGGDGIQSSNTDESDKGYVHITGGSINITAGDDGIQAANTIQIDDGTIVVKATAASSDDKVRGINAGTDLTINGGTITVTTKDGYSSNDDAIHASGSIYLNGGTITVSCGDDGVHADADVVLNGATLTVSSSTEGIEGNRIYIKSGTAYVTASDDGVNAYSNDSDEIAANPYAGTYTPLISVSGGYLDVTVPNGDTDGIDSNGNYEQTGGVVLVKSSATGGMAGTMDVDGTVSVTGGSLISLGGTECYPGSSSCNTVFVSSVSFSSGTYTVTDSSGNTVLSFTVSGSYSGGYICSDALTIGESYTLSKSGSSVYTWTQSSQTVGSAGSSGMGDMGGNSGGPGGNSGFGGGGFGY